MQTIFLHGFAATADIWVSPLVNMAPRVNFFNINRSAEELTDKIHDRSILIGWSMGGMIAMRMAVLAKKQIKGLVLISTAPKFLSSLDYPQGISPAILKRLRRSIKAEGIAAFHKLVFGKCNVAGLARISCDQAEKELDELAKIDLREELSQIECPTLIIHGNKDKICLPAAAEYLKSNIPNSCLVILSGVGHAPMVESPDLFNHHLKKFVNNYAG